MQFTPYLNFSGQCETAFKFYEKNLGGKIAALVSFGDTPMADKTPPEWRSKICHVTLLVGDGALMGCDATPDRFEPIKGAWITFVPKDTAEAERVFNAMSANGKVIMPLQKTFWAASFGMFTDQFGVSWMINCEKSS
jgi:PhnB protein